MEKYVYMLVYHGIFDPKSRAAVSLLPTISYHILRLHPVRWAPRMSTDDSKYICSPWGSRPRNPQDHGNAVLQSPFFWISLIIVIKSWRLALLNTIIANKRDDSIKRYEGLKLCHLWSFIFHMYMNANKSRITRRSISYFIFKKHTDVD